MGKTAQGAVWLNADMLQPVRLLAVLAQHRRRRRRPVPAPVHRPAARRDRPAGSTAKAPASTTPRRCWPTTRPRCCTAPRPPATARRPPRRRSSRAGCRPTCRRSNWPRADVVGAMIAALATRRRPDGVERRGAPPGPGRRPAPQRRAGSRRQPVRSRLPTSMRRRAQAGRRQEEDRAGPRRLTRLATVRIANARAQGPRETHREQARFLAPAPPARTRREERARADRAQSVAIAQRCG